MIIHWAGGESKVIVALTKDIHATLSSTSSVFVSDNYGGSFEKKQLSINKTCDGITEKFYNSPLHNSHVCITINDSCNL